jgi:deazaflavin-dependent oxidoreductase (nitroreductase family)
MQATSLKDHKPTGLLRLGLRLPIWLFRTHLGWLLGDRFLMLTHIGRKSGLPRKVVVEVLRHDRANEIYYVTSGWGSQADWYRNLQKTPDVNITVGGRTLPVHAEFLFLEGGEREMTEYARQHPTAFRELTRVFLGKSISPTPEALHDIATKMPVIAFHPK